MKNVSASDYEMARFFGRQGHSVEFIFNGNNSESIDHDENVEMIDTKELFNKGAFEYLSGVTAKLQ